MANSQKRKGDKAEREAAEMLSTLFGLPIRRKLGAGRTNAAGGDTGDLEGLPDHVIQVADWADVAAAARIKPAAAAMQAANACQPHGVALVRFRGGRWRVVMTVAQWASYVTRRTRPIDEAAP